MTKIATIEGALRLFLEDVVLGNWIGEQNLIHTISNGVLQRKALSERSKDGSNDKIINNHSNNYYNYYHALDDAWMEPNGTENQLFDPEHSFFGERKLLYKDMVQPSLSHQSFDSRDMIDETKFDSDGKRAIFNNEHRSHKKSIGQRQAQEHHNQSNVQSGVDITYIMQEIERQLVLELACCPMGIYG